MLHVVCVYARIIDTFQLIDTLETRKKSKGGQRNHHGAIDKSSSKQQNCSGMTIIFAVQKPGTIGLAQLGLTAGRPAARQMKLWLFQKN